MKTYYALASFRAEGDAGHVLVREDNGAPARLSFRTDLRNHSPSGLSWGFGGSGPAQLALAILADLYGDDLALEHYQAFKFRVIGHLPQDDGFALAEEQIQKVMQDLELERTGREAEANPGGA